MVNSVSYEKLLKEVQMEAKRAQGKTSALKRQGISTPAFAILQRSTPDLKANKNMTYKDLQHRLSIYRKFNLSVSSSYSGMKSVMAKRDKTLMTKYGIDKKQLTNLYKLFESEEYAKLRDVLSYEFIIDAAVSGTSEDYVKSLKETIEGYPTSGEYMLDYLEEKFGVIYEGETIPIGVATPHPLYPNGKN